MWKQLKTDTNSNNVDITISQFYETKRQSQPPALGIFDTHFMFTISNYVENNKLCYNHDTNEENSYISNDILNGKITRNEIENAIRKTKNDKATGIDGLPLELISSNTLVSTPILECLFYNIFVSYSYPERWVDVVITPIFKSGSKKDPENYRKVTVLPALGTLFEIVLASHLKFKNNVCSDNDPFQADFTKAFDYIHRNALIYKLLKRNVIGNFLNLIKSMFSK